MSIGRIVGFLGSPDNTGLGQKGHTHTGTVKGPTARKAAHHATVTSGKHRKKAVAYVRHPRGDTLTDSRQAYLAGHRKRAYHRRKR